MLHIACEYTATKLQEEYVECCATTATRVPTLIIDATEISGLPATAHYLCENSKLYPKDLLARAQIDSWIDFINRKIREQMCTIFCTVFGCKPCERPKYYEAVNHMKKEFEIPQKL